MDKTGKSKVIYSVIAVIVVVAMIGVIITVNGWWGLIMNTPRQPQSNDNNEDRTEPVRSNFTIGNKSTPTSYSDMFKVIHDSNPPRLTDKGLRVEKVISGLTMPTSMKFVGHNDILILEKEDGMVRLVSNGTLQPLPIFQTIVEKNSEHGLLGLAVSNGDNTNDTKTTIIFLYFTEADSSGEVRNRIYRYEWDGKGNITAGKMILDLPGTPGPNHDGGKMAIGPDGMLYAVIGDLNRNGMNQNIKNGPKPDDTSVILRIDQNGNSAKNNNILTDSDPIINSTLAKYYAYGIRNSFGLAFDPTTGNLWDTENGPDRNDELNMITPGFNSGWKQITGPIERTNKSVNELMQFSGSHYQDPMFTWSRPIGVTDIEFVNSTKIGEKYTNNIFVGDIINGNIYFFTVNKERNGLVLSDGLQDLVADDPQEVSEVTLGTGFSGGITNIETGPDGYPYILTFAGNLYRIVPSDKPSLEQSQNN